MKVGTDGVLLGSWCNVTDAKRVLDIGCGTGLVSLMVAQRKLTATVLGIDISELAIGDCEHNFNASDWSDRLSAKQISVQEFAHSYDAKFDLIVSNPPFFNRSLKSEAQHKNLARHDDSLSFDDLFKCSAKLLSDTGFLTIIIPFDRQEESVKIALQQKLFLQRECFVYPKQESELPKRVLQVFGFDKITTTIERLYVEKERHEYTDDYRELTKEFYLKF